jgi:hypothetical protein
VLSGDERFVPQEIPFLQGHLSPQLRKLLDSHGNKYLNAGDPGQDYTLPQAAEALSWLVGRKISAT